MIAVSSADRVVYPEAGHTKGDVVAYFERLAARIFPHLEGRPLSILRFPKGLAEKGFFQKNVPAHYPHDIQRFEVPRSREASRRHRDPDARQKDVTTYPVLTSAEHVPYVANQGALELHAPTSRAAALLRPDRLIIDLDPPPGAVALVRRAAHSVRDALRRLGLDTTPVATGSKGYHLVARIHPVLEADVLGRALHQLATWLAASQGELLTTTFRVAERGERVFLDWLRNHTLATAVTPYSLRAKPRATVATPLSWGELDTHAPDAFALADAERLLDRPDHLLDAAVQDAAPFVKAVEEQFQRAGLALETFDRFRS